MKYFAAALAALGVVLIWFGSYVCIATPGDGQSAMIVFPAWFLGGMLGFAAAGIVIFNRSSRSFRTTVGIMATMALTSVFFAFLAVITYHAPVLTQVNTQTAEHQKP